MTSTATTASSTEQPPAGRRHARKKSRRRRWIVWTILAVLLVALAIAGYWAYWLATGLLDASRTVQDKASVAQAELQAFRDTLKAGDEEAARNHLDVAEDAIDDAKDAAGSKQVRQAKGLPYVGDTVADLDHLLAAAGIMTDTGRDAMVVYEKFSGDDSELFQDGKFSIPAIQEAQESVTAIGRSVDLAERELRKVSGKGPKGKEALAKKRSGLEQIASLRAEIEPLEPVLAALPSAVGAEGRKKYLVAIMNPAEMRASGGAPLSLMFVSFKNGKLKTVLQGTTSTITLGSAPGLLGDSPELVWPRVKNDPFQPPVGEPQRFVNASFNPDFAVSAEQMRRATPTFFGHRTDGVIALDMVAIAHLMEVTGPIESNYGWLTPDNVVKKLLVTAYNEQGTAIAERQAENDRLLALMMAHLTGGGGLLDKARALGGAVPSRHLQMYFKDERLQQLVEEKKLGGMVPDPDFGNLSAVFTQNGNGSKLDVFQERRVVETVRLRKDGSAVVRRDVVLRNPTPRYTGLGPDPRRGYNTRWATNLIINLMPDGAKVTEEPEVALRSTVDSGVDQDGRTFAKAAVVIPPDEEVTVSWEYVLPKAAKKAKDGTWRFVSRTAPQAIINVPEYQLTLKVPEGWTIAPGPRWTSEGGSATITIPMDRQDVIRARVAPQ